MARYIDKNIEINQENVKDFFRQRANKISEGNEVLTSVLYQDSNPELAIQRNKQEKETLKKLIKLNNDNCVLDIGCGIGRWAEFFYNQNVKSYHGIDFMEEFINYARTNYTYNENYTYQVLDVSKLNKNILNNYKEYNVIMISGVLVYLNDDILKLILLEINKLCSDNCLFIIREPISINGRLTLKNIESDELKQTYNAIYRTVDELELFFRKYLNASIFYSKDLYKKELNNRKETKQHLFLFRKGVNDD
jgi:2-polyprenyl-3-methyl-5-hydroxy-6-metoxy-1,4-benzoquinol methylase